MAIDPEVKRLYAILFLCILASHGRAATVTGSIADATGTLVTNAVITFHPISTPQVETGIILLSTAQKITATNGTFSVMLEQGDYRVSVSGRDQFTISVPNDTTTNSIQDLVTSSLTYIYTAPPIYQFFTNGIWLLTQGGTGATNAAGARAALGLGEWTTNSTVPVTGGAFTNLTELPIPLAQGGTGATNESLARAALGVAEWTTNSAVPAPSGQFTNITAVPVQLTEGGTGAADADAARLNLGLGTVATEDVVPPAKGGTGVGATGSWVPTFLAAADTGTARTALGITGTNVSGYNATQFDAGSTTNLQIKASALTTNQNLVGTYPFINGSYITPGPTKAFSDFATGITGWSGWNGGSVAWNSADQNIKIVATSWSRGANTPVSLTSGRVYRMTCTVSSNEVGSGTLYGVANWANYIAGLTNIGAVGSYDITFTAPTTGTLILVNNSASCTNYLDNVHVYEVTGTDRNIVVASDLVRSNYVKAVTGLYTNFVYGPVAHHGTTTKPVLLSESALLAGTPYVWNDGELDSGGLAAFTGSTLARDTTTNVFLVNYGVQIGYASLPTNRYYRLSWCQTNMTGGGFVLHKIWGSPVVTQTTDGLKFCDFFQSSSNATYGARPILVAVGGSGTSNVLDNVHLQDITDWTDRTYALTSEIYPAIMAVQSTNEYVVLDDDFNGTFAWTKTWGTESYTNDTTAGYIKYWDDDLPAGFYRNISTTIGERYGISILVTNSVSSRPVIFGSGWALTIASTTNGWNHMSFIATLTQHPVGFWTYPYASTNIVARYVVTRMPMSRGVAHNGDIWAALQNVTNQAHVVMGSGSSVEGGMYNQVAIGKGATAGMQYAVAIGYNAVANGDTSWGGSVAEGPYSLAIGHDAKACSMRAVAVGGGAVAASTSAIAVGPGAWDQKVHGTVVGRGAAIWTNTPNATIVLGAADITHELFLGNSWGNGLPERYDGFGAGGTNLPSANYSRFNGPNAFDARTNAVLYGNCPGGPIKIAGGRSTGSGTGGEIHFETTPATGAAGTNTQNALVIAGKFDATTTTNSGTYCATRFLLLDTVSGTVKRVYLHPTPDSGGTGFRMLVTPN